MMKQFKIDGLFFPPESYSEYNSQKNNLQMT